MSAVTYAKTHLSALIRRAEAGEPMTITRRGRPVAVLGPLPATESIPLIGALKGRIRIAEDFDVLPPDFRHL